MKPKRVGLLLECLLVVSGIVFWVFRLKNMLFTGLSIPIHDTYYWEFPLFHFFAENLILGQLPLWNPYSHGGEPFYPILVHLKFLDPVALLTVYLGKTFTHDTAILLNWYRFLQTTLMVVGGWFLFRRFTQQNVTRLTLILILFLSSTFVGGYRQHGIILLGSWLPYVALIVLKIFVDRDYRIRNFLVFGWLVGMQTQSYYYLGVWVFLAFALLGCVLFKRVLIQEYFQSRNLIGTLWAFFIILIMALPNLVLLYESKDYVYPARMLTPSAQPLSQPHQYEEGIGAEASYLNYDFIAHTGTFSTPWDFLQLLSPHANRAVSRIDSSWGEPSEAYLYFGVLSWCLCLLGIFFGSHGLKKMVLLIFSLSGLLLLGPAGGVHRVLYWIFPLIQPMRHTDALALVFEFSALFFIVLGLDALLATKSNNPMKLSLTVRQLPGVLFGVASFTMAYLVATQLRYPLSFHLYLGIAGVIILGYAFCRIFGRTVLFWSLLLGQALTVNALSRTRSADSLQFLLLGIVPLLLLWKNRKWQIKSAVVPVAVLLVIAIDLGAHLETKFILNGFPHPKFLTVANSRVQKLEFPGARKLYSIGSNQFFQAIRYLELLRHEPVAYSPTENGLETSLTEMQLSRRWNTLIALKSYSELLHSNLKSDFLQSAFLIGRSPIELSDSNASYFPQSYDNSDLKLLVKAPEGTSLYWADGFHRYWTATVDGMPVEIKQARKNFKQIDLAKGEHLVSFSFYPFPFIVALYLFLIALIMVPVFLMVQYGTQFRFRSIGLRAGKFQFEIG